MAVMAVDMVGRSSISAGPSLLHVSEMKKKVCSTVNDRPLASTAAARRDLLLSCRRILLSG